MSEKTLRDVYGHHHPDYLQGAATAIGAKKPVSLVISLVKQRQRRSLSSQRIENTGGGRSRIRTRLHFQIPWYSLTLCEPEKYLTGLGSSIRLD